MALTGTYQRTLDDKQRLAIPKRLRDAMGEAELQELYIAPEVGRALSVFSPRAFERRAARIEELSTGRSGVVNYLRLYYSQAERVEIDAQGRIRLPERLVEFAQLQEDVVLLGVHDHIEIWDSALWNDFLKEHSLEFDRLAREALP
ncbi:MAG: cell division protein [Planctomycetaceae bacterium]|nr:cell division protein [Planctomycetaceae bacterium]